MSSNKNLRLAVKLALMSGAAAAFMLSAPLYAQDQDADEAAEDTLEEVIVTGSRIARNTFATPAPVTVLDAMEIQAVGATNVGAKNLPSKSRYRPTRSGNTR